jgi:signal transduction histidine kinase/ActR/RegA family two-component response regulator
MNPAFSELFELQTSDGIGLSVTEVFEERLSTLIEQRLREAQSGEASSLNEPLQIHIKNKALHILPSILQTSSLQTSSLQTSSLQNGENQKDSGFYLFIRDVSASRNVISTLRDLHLITSDNQLDVDSKIQSLLKLGKETFDLPLAIVSHIAGEEYVVKYSDTPNDEVKPGDTFELGVTYCLHTLQADGPLAFDHAENSSIGDHPCYSAFGLESYIGVPLIVSNRRYGTLNFSGPEIHARPFSTDDLELIRLFAQWIGNELTRQKIEQELVRRQGLLESMSSLARIGAWEVDLESGTVLWSSMTKEIHEVAEDFVPTVDQGIEFYKEGKSRTLIKQAIDKAIEDGTPWSLECQLVTAKGNEIWVAALGKSEFVNGKCVRLFGSFQDIDEKVKSERELIKAKEKAEAATRSKSEFLANMSHEIRTPMNGVYGMLTSLLTHQLDAEALKKIDIAKSSAQSLLAIINDILDLSKIESGHLGLEQADFDLAQVFDEITLSMEHLAKEKSLDFSVDFQANSGSIVNGDAVRVKQVLNNLVGNALKFTQAGEVRVKARLNTEGSHRELVCEVADTGIGIPAERHKDLFQAFTQADTSTTRKFGGTGLGLAIAKQLCTLMNGEISFDSEESVGSTFRFKIQLNAPENSTHQATDALHGRASEGYSDNNRILLVEDNQVNQIVALELLKQLGLAADLAVDGQDAINQLKRTDSPYDLILMDCQMPVMDGYQATKAIRAGEAGEPNRSTKIVALTANAMKGDREICLQAGMDDYVSKPLEIDEFNAVLSRYLA